MPPVAKTKQEFPYIFNNNGVPDPLDITTALNTLFFNPDNYPNAGGSYPVPVGDDNETFYRPDVIRWGGIELWLEVNFRDSEELEVIVMASKTYNGLLTPAPKVTFNAADQKETIISPSIVKLKRDEWGGFQAGANNSVVIPCPFFVPSTNFIQAYIRDITTGFPGGGDRALLHSLDIQLGHGAF